MADLLSEQIGAFREDLTGWLVKGVRIEPDGVEALDALFVGWQAQAKALEDGEPVAPESLDEVSAAIVAETQALTALSRKLEGLVDRMTAGRLPLLKAL